MTAAPHSEREHATWSASSTARNWACPGSLALSENAPPEKENPAAAWGTACHQVSEKCLRDPTLSPHDFIGTFEKTKDHEIEVDDEMADTAAQYVDYVRERVKKATRLWIEERFSLESLKPPFDAGGTCDAIVYSRTEKTLEVIDLKGGRGVVVDVIGNHQLRTYALGAMLTHGLLPITKVIVTIVQPRAPHKDGRIRSEEFHIADLLEWTDLLLRAMQRSKKAKDTFVIAPTMTWTADYLRAGDHCKFCPAKPTCPAIRQKALDAAGVWFDDLDQPRISNEPHMKDGEALARDLDILDMVEEWASSLRAYAHRQAEAGVEIPGYVLTEKISNRKWASEAVAYDFLRDELFLSAGEINTSKMKSPAQIEKLLGKNKAAIADLVVREVTGTNLVKATKTSRPAVQSAAERFFEKLED